MRYKFSDFVKEFSYYDFKAVSVQRYDGRWSHGYLYYLTAPIKEEVQKVMLENYGNVAFYHSEAQYAPEIQKPLIFIGRSSIRGKK